ncbi:MAG: SGNH/GDSL hydrolase family protein [Planctomycetes bacterium]|nr:SGNH/GDSL hydrolase family protein [Planctomycetota bacterium]
MRRSWSITLLVAALCALAGLGAGRYSAARQRTLHELGRWGSSKTDCRKGVIGGAMARLTRPMLFRERVDLGAWFGFQEIYLREPLPFLQCTFRFRLEPGAWLAVEFDRGDALFEVLQGFRLSALADKPSAGFRTDAKGLFESLEPIPVAPFDSAWHDAALRFSESACLLLVDGRPVASVPVPPSPAQPGGRDPAVRSRRIGFRGGFRSALVDDVVLTRGRETLLVERFDRDDLLPGHAALGASIAAGLWLLLAAGLRRRRGPVRWLAPTAVLATLSLLAWALALLDDHWLASLYPRDPLQKPDYANTMFRPEEPELTWAERHPGRDPERARRILFAGGSQTWGSGARVEADVWTRLVERELDRRAPDPGWRCRNVAVCGDSLAQQAARCDSRALDEFRPEVVVVDAGHNDLDPAAFGQALVDLWSAARRRGARLVCVLEANSPEADPLPYLARNHTVMRELANGAGVPVIDMHALLASQDERGFLWWDRVHLSSAGQQLLAEALTERLLELLR